MAQQNIVGDLNVTGILKKNNLQIDDSVAYLTTAPSADNTSGRLQFVVLDTEPSTYYNGYYYIITGSN